MITGKNHLFHFKYQNIMLYVVPKKCHETFPKINESILGRSQNIYLLYHDFYKLATLYFMYK